LIKSAITFSNKLNRLRHTSTPHRISPLYTFLELNIIPWFLVYIFISFLDLWSTTIQHSFGKASQDALVRDAIAFAIAVLLAAVESFSPRPSRFSSRSRRQSAQVTGDLPKAPEMNASLFSQATFAFVDPFMFRAAFPSKDTPSPPVNMKTIPDVRRHPWPR
jgi:hypothetical protein